MWVDASGVQKVIAAIFEDNDSFKYCYLPVTAVVMREWFERKDNYIGVLEMLSVIMGVWTFIEELNDCMLTIYCDNLGVVHSCLRAASRSLEINQMVSRLWLECARRNIGVVIFQVESESNPADDPSRMEFSWL